MARVGEKLTGTDVAFLEEPNYAVVTVLTERGAARSTVLWVDTDGENLVLNTTTDRAKPRHLKRDPRVTVLVWDRHDPYRWLEVEGAAELDEDGADDHIHKLSRKYRGREYDKPWDRVIVRVRPRRVEAYGLD